MSRSSMALLSSKGYMTSRETPVVQYDNPIQYSNTLKNSLLKEQQKKKKPYLLELPELQIKRSKTMLGQLSESTRTKTSPFVSETIPIHLLESISKPKKKVKKSVTIPQNNFIQIVEIESFKRYNFMEEVKEKEYDIYTKRCCLIF